MFKDGLKTAVILFLMLCFAAYLTTAFYNYWMDVTDLGFTLPAETLYPFKEGNRWGYINVKGEKIVSPVFFRADMFDENYARVALPTIWCDLWPELSLGIGRYFQRDGKISESIKSANRWPGEFNLVYDRDVRKWGYVGKNGEWAIPARFDSARPFYEGFAAVMMREDEWNFIDEEGDLISDCLYTYVDKFSDGLAWVESKENGKWGAIDTGGEFIVLPTFTRWPRPFYGGVAGVPVESSKWGVYDKKTKRIIAEGFDRLEPFYQGRAEARQCEKVGFINIAGEWVVPPQYKYARQFSEGLAAVCKKGRWGYIDLNGNVVIPFSFKSADDFQKGLARVNGNFHPKIIEEFDYIDKQGNYIYRKKS